MIPVFDLLKPYRKAQIDILLAAFRVIESGNYILGEEVRKFEEEFAKATGNLWCVGCGNGTDAISIALIALGIQSGHEVITPSFTAFPTIVGIIRSGAKPILIDVKKDILIDETKIEKAITKKTKAIVPVHLFNQKCNMKAIMRIARRHHLEIIEDCAQRTFTKISGRCGAFSFYPTKTLGAYGDAGAVCTNDKEIFEKLKALRDYGQTEKNVFTYQGLNSRLDEIQAAILRVKLKNKCFMEKPQIKFSLYRHYTMLEYQMAGIRSLIHYPYTINQQPAFKGQKKEKFPMSERIAKSIFTLPPKKYLTRE